MRDHINYLFVSAQLCFCCPFNFDLFPAVITDPAGMPGTRPANRGSGLHGEAHRGLPQTAAAAVCRPRPHLSGRHHQTDRGKQICTQS